MTDSVFDVALEKRFADSASAIEVTSLDTLLIRKVETGEIFKLPVSILTDAISAAAPVKSVAGKTGVVVLSKSDVGLSNVDNTSDLQKNSATATLTNKTLESPAITGIADLSGGRIKFPGTQEASPDGTTLDDYRENGYSPTVATQSGSLASYAISAQFTKIGRFVIVQGRLTISDKGNANGSILISLPYTPVFQRSVGMVAEIAQTGKTGKALIYGTDNNAYLTFYDNTFLTVSGYDITFNISYWTN